MAENVVDAVENVGLELGRPNGEAEVWDVDSGRISDVQLDGVALDGVERYNRESTSSGKSSFDQAAQEDGVRLRSGRHDSGDQSVACYASDASDGRGGDIVRIEAGGNVVSSAFDVAHEALVQPGNGDETLFRGLGSVETGGRDVDVMVEWLEGEFRNKGAGQAGCHTRVAVDLEHAEALEVNENPVTGLGASERYKGLEDRLSVGVGHDGGLVDGQGPDARSDSGGKWWRRRSRVGQMNEGFAARMNDDADHRRKVRSFPEHLTEGPGGTPGPTHHVASSHG